MPNTLKQIIQNKENSVVEFKSAEFRNESLAKEIVAFLNTSGGSIFIGVEDDGVVTGVKDKGLEERIINICRNAVTPSLIPEIYFYNADSGETVIEVKIEKGKNKPYKISNANRFYIRAGSVSIEPTNEELIRMFQEGQQLHFEVGILPGVAFSEYCDLVRFSEYCKNQRKIEVELEEFSQIAYNFDVIDENKNMTIAGMLLFGKKIDRYLPQAGIQLFKYSGSDKISDIRDHQEESGDMISCIENAEKFVRNNSQNKADFNAEETRRVDTPDYEPFVIRELLANAFAHRDWSIFGQKIRLEIFDDRLELFSPGKLPNSINLTRATNGVSFYRNPLIAQILKDYGIVDKAGRGLQKILHFFKSKDLSVPIFEEDLFSFKTILKKRNS